MAKTSKRRQERRYNVPSALGALFEFDDQEGEHQELQLTEIGIQGAAFIMPTRIPGVERGAMLANVVIRVALTDIEGNASVVHSTPAGESRFKCGILFFPKTEKDRNQLVSLITSLDSPRSNEQERD